MWDHHGHLNSSALVPRPDLIDFDKLKDSNARHNLEHAFDVAERQLGIIPLLDPEGESHPFYSLPGLVQVPGKLMGRVFKALDPPSFSFVVHGSDVGLIIDKKASAQFFCFFWNSLCS